MTSNLIRYSALVGVVAVIVSGCASKPPLKTSATSLVQAQAKLNADIERCIQRYGYDPAKEAGIAENALAPNELQWRQCVHEAQGAYAKVNTAMAPMYAALIANDIAMTAAIQQGTMTRAQRQASSEKLVEQIKRADDKLIADITQEQQRQALERENAVTAIRSLRGGFEGGAIH